MRHIKILFLLLFLVATPAWGAATFDAAITAFGVNVSGITTGSLTITGSNTLVVCTAHFYSSAGGVVSGTPTFNAAGMTHKDSESPVANVLQDMWFKIAPSTGVAAFNFTQSDVVGVVGCDSFAGANQTTPLGTVTKQDSDLSTGAAVTVPTNGLGLDVVFTAFATSACEDLVPGGSQTELYGAAGGNDCANDGPGNSVVAGSSTVSASTTMTWTNHSGAYHGQMTVPISPAAAGSAPPRREIRWQ